MNDATHAYVGYRPCGHPVSLMVDMPDDRKTTASWVAQEIRDGHRIELVTIERAREIGVTYCSCVQPAEYEATRNKRMTRARAIKKRGYR